MLQVGALHHHQSAVVTPPVGMSITFPLRGAISVAYTKHMEVSHGKIEGAIRTAKDMRVAYAMLLSYGVARDEGEVVVECPKLIPVVAHRHV